MTETSSEGRGRETTQLDRIADAYLERLCELGPISATSMGIAGYDDRLDDFSPAGRAQVAQAHRDLLAELDQAEVVDDIDTVTMSALRERAGLALELHESGLVDMELNVIASPLQDVRAVFDLMPTDSPAALERFTARMAAIPAALEGYVSSLRLAKGRGDVAPRRQVSACVQQCREYAADDGFFGTVADRVAHGTPQHEALQQAVDAAGAAYRRLADTLETELLPDAPEADACGRERYQLLSRVYLGSVVDLEETYAWGQEELARITADMARTAQEVLPGATVKEAIAQLDSDSAYLLHGTEELQRWMQGKADEAIQELSGEHFDIPSPVQRIECMIAPTHSGGIYYTQPSEDFTRPGRMWWSVPRGVEQFGTWRELTTVYHEGVPGHHLQVAQTVFRAELLNRWRRLCCWVSGSGEGWALYAERLMDELGYLQDPGNRLGMLDGQSLRAARVVLDIGVHCGFPAPDEVGGGEWDYDKAWTFLTSHANMAEGFLRFELDRYLGWPGQAPSYKVGERIWLQLREDAKAKAGDDFDIRTFHRKALDVGSVGLDTLRAAVLT